jgi:hypothetical protein
LPIGKLKTRQLLVVNNRAVVARWNIPLALAAIGALTRQLLLLLQLGLIE